MSIIKEYRKAGTDRRGGADRRQSLLPRYHDTERRTGNERRVFEDRRLRVLLAKKQPDPSSGLIGFLLKTGWKNGLEKRSKKENPIRFQKTRFIWTIPRRDHMNAIHVRLPFKSTTRTPAGFSRVPPAITARWACIWNRITHQGSAWVSCSEWSIIRPDLRRPRTSPNTTPG